MFKNKRLLTAVILTIGMVFLFAGPSAAKAIKLEKGSAMIGQHYGKVDGQMQMLDQYYIMVKKQEVKAVRDIQVKKLDVDDRYLSDGSFQFDEDVTNRKAFGNSEANDFFFFTIDDFSVSKYKKKRDKLITKVEKKLLKLKAKEEGLKFKKIKNDPLYDMSDWEVWASDLGQKIFNKKKIAKMKIYDADGNKYKAKLTMAFFMNSSPGPAGRPVSIPEPATMLLLGVGLLGLAGVHRRFKK